MSGPRATHDETADSRHQALDRAFLIDWSPPHQPCGEIVVARMVGDVPEATWTKAGSSVSNSRMAESLWTVTTVGPEMKTGGVVSLAGVGVGVTSLLNKMPSDDSDQAPTLPALSTARTRQ